MAQIKLEMSGAKLELNGSEELIKNESARFYYELGLTDELPEKTIYSANISCGSIGERATQACSAGECVLSYRLTEAPLSWEKIIDGVKDGSLRLNVGDMVSCKLKDGRKVDLVVTDITDSVVRFESRDCLGEKVKYTGLDEYLGRIFGLFPNSLQAAILPTERICLDADGNLKTDIYRLFVPSCSEVMPEDECIGDKGVYKQLDWYKDRRHRIRCDEKGGDTCWWWAVSAYSGSSTYFVLVNHNGNVYNGSARSAAYAPVCFQIPIKWTPLIPQPCTPLHGSALNYDQKMVARIKQWHLLNRQPRKTPGVAYRVRWHYVRTITQKSIRADGGGRNNTNRTAEAMSDTKRTIAIVLA